MSKLPIVLLHEAFMNGCVPVMMEKVTSYDRVIEEYFLPVMCSPKIAPLWKKTDIECSARLGITCIAMDSHFVVGPTEVSVARVTEHDCLAGHLMYLVNAVVRGEMQLYEAMTAIIDTVATRSYLHSTKLENIH